MCVKTKELGPVDPPNELGVKKILGRAQSVMWVVMLYLNAVVDLLSCAFLCGRSSQKVTTYRLELMYEDESLLRHLLYCQWLQTLKMEGSTVHSFSSLDFMHTFYTGAPWLTLFGFLIVKL